MPWYLQSLTLQPTFCTQFFPCLFSVIALPPLWFPYSLGAVELWPTGEISVCRRTEKYAGREKRMSLYAIGDLHLALGAPEKSMEIFGGALAKLYGKN